MVSLRLHRIGASALAESPTRVGVSREAVEAAVEEGGAQPLRLHRLGVSVFAKAPPQPGVQRFTTEAAVEEGGAQPLRLHRLGASAFAESPPRVSVQRAAVEAAVTAGGAQALRLHRIGVSAFVARGLPPPVPLPLADGISFFLHNWTDDCTIETSYSTDIGRAPVTGAEDRLSLFERPERVLSLRWLVESGDEAFALKKLLRQMTRENFQVPLYPDAVTFDDALSAATSITAEVRNRRFFAGARVALFRNTARHISADDVVTKIIQSVTPTGLVFTEALGQDMAGWAVVPLIDCEILIDPQRRMLTGGTASREVSEVTMTVREVRGANTLPPLEVGNPDGWTVKLGYPVLEFAPDWSGGLDESYERDGTSRRVGRRNLPILDGERYRQVQQWPLNVTERAEWRRIAGFFDTRRGRAGAFWVIDRDWGWQVVTNSASTIFIEPRGDFDYFAEVWSEESAGVGIVMRDGTIHLAQVFSVTDNGSSWRLTLAFGQTIPSALDVSEIERVAPARLCRFDSDAMTEQWRTTEVCDITLTTRELHHERDVDIDTNNP